MSCVYKYNTNGEVIQIAHDKNSIEKMVIKHNTNHFKQALQSDLCRDKIFPKLSNDSTQQSVISGKLGEDECTNRDVYEFITLLKANVKTLSNQYQPITSNDFRTVVKKSKNKKFLFYFLW